MGGEGAGTGSFELLCKDDNLLFLRSVLWGGRILLLELLEFSLLDGLRSLLLLPPPGLVLLQPPHLLLPGPLLLRLSQQHLLLLTIISSHSHKESVRIS